MNRDGDSSRSLLLFSVFALGFASLSAQIVFLRELMARFYGNELSLGIALGSWLFWNGAGSLLGGRIADRLRDPLRLFVFAPLLLAPLLPSTLLAIRSVRPLLGLSPGQVIGFVRIFESAFAILAPFCLLNGCLFSFACAADARRRSLPAEGLGIGLVYAAEALGAVAGGLLTSLLLIRLLSPSALVSSLAGLPLAAGAALAFSRRGGGAEKAILALAVLLFALVLGRSVPARLESASLRREWRGLGLERVENTPYGNLVLTAREGQVSLFENGILSFTRPDPAAAEEAVHFPLLMHPGPRRVLLIGGGMGGALEEILKYPTVEEAVYVEIDPGIVRLAETGLKPGERAFLDDPRVEVVNTDGRRHLLSSVRYDSIIVNLPDPFTAQINRFYTREFFALARRRLAPGGTLGIAASGAENYIGGELQNYLACLRATLASAFPHLVALPGETCRFVASDRADWLTADPAALEGRVRERGLDLKYVRAYYLSDRLRPDRVAYLREKLGSAPRVSLNLDFRPLSYFYDLVFWSTYFRGEGEGWFTRLLARATSLRWWWFLALPPAAFFLSRLRRGGKAGGGWVIFPVFASGFSEIVFQVVILLAFQIFYGSVYYKLGLIVSLFMAGLAAGGAAAVRLLPRIARPRRLMLEVEGALCLYPLLLPAVFALAARFPGLLPPALGEWVLFPLLPLVGGFIGGFQFSIAARIRLRGSFGAGRTAGAVYGADLLGSCLGALLVSAFLIPILGLFPTCLAASLLNLSALAAIAAGRKKGGPKPLTIYQRRYICSTATTETRGRG